LPSSIVEADDRQCNADDSFAGDVSVSHVNVGRLKIGKTAISGLMLRPAALSSPGFLARVSFVVGRGMGMME
jgi:hypothetical protein